MSTSQNDVNDPTPALKTRVQAWMAVLDHVETYLCAAAQRYDGIYAATAQLSREMPQPTNLDSEFAPLGRGGIQDLFAKLWWDLNLPDGNAAEKASRVIKNELLREVELLRMDLVSSIKDYDKASEGFSKTHSLMPTITLDPSFQKRIKQFENSVKAAELGMQPDVDPFILKMELDKKIESFMRKHNHQADLYKYVIEAAKQLDGEVTERLQGILRWYTNIVEQNADIIAKGAQDARSVFISQPRLFEYKYWLSKSAVPINFQNATAKQHVKFKHTSELTYANQDSPYARAVRIGMLERRTKFLHTFSAGEYVLTNLSLIEVRQLQPVWTIDLVDAKVFRNANSTDPQQFVVQARQHKSTSGKQHLFTFRAKNPAKWIRDIERITSSPGHTFIEPSSPGSVKTSTTVGTIKPLQKQKPPVYQDGKDGATSKDKAASSSGAQEKESTPVEKMNKFTIQSDSDSDGDSASDDDGDVEVANVPVDTDSDVSDLSESFDDDGKAQKDTLAVKAEKDAGVFK